MACPPHDPVVIVGDAARPDETYIRTTCRACGASLDETIAEVEATPVEEAPLSIPGEALAPEAIEDLLYGQTPQAD